jgi:hypothetical protein
MPYTPKKKGHFGPPKALSIPYLLNMIRSRSRECGDCWEWEGSVTGGRTPMVYHNLQRRPVRTLILEALTGKTTPHGHVASTTCGNSWCVNPEHARYITKAKMLDRTRANTNQVARAAKIAAGHIRRGNCKIDDAALARIMNSDEPGCLLAQELGVDQSLVSGYRRGKKGRFRNANPFGGLIAR